MKHVSIPVEDSAEFIFDRQLNPLISHCQIKVCYVGNEPNRNGTVISKAVATEMGKKLPGSPIVGFFNKETGDFEEHNRDVEIKDGKVAIVDVTKPYGFVPMNAEVWFQKFTDDGVEHEYLMTEGILWTGAYPEAKRVAEIGNNQSMELHADSVQGNWAESVNNRGRFFIINEAMIEKLCILGDNVEPCFEGAQIATRFSLEQEFAELKNTMFTMMNELKEALQEGGSQGTMDNEKILENALEVEVEAAEEPVVEETFAEVAEPEVAAEAPTEEFAKEDKKPEDESEDEAEEEDADTEEEDEDEKKKPATENALEEEEQTYSLEEYSALQNQYAELQAQYDALVAEVEPLKSFKLAAERKEKEDMINQFYMLSDELKADVVANIDNYSLDEIEAKLAVICVRNKVNFNLDAEKVEEPMTFNLSGAEQSKDAGVPEWVKAVKQHASNM